MPNESAWRNAVATHQAAIAAFRAQVTRVPAEQWHVSVAEGKWSPAEEALHVVMAYELACANVAGGAAMRLRVSPLRATFLRWFLLPWLLRTGKFPRGVAAPREVRPASDVASTLTPPALLQRLEHAAAAAAAALRATEGRTPPLRFNHAYFGPLRPLIGLRLLSAHTRHHARRLAQRSAEPGLRSTESMRA